MKFAASSLAIAALAGSAVAGVYSNTTSVPAYGFTRVIEIYRVASDLSAPNSVRLEPEGMTWYNGTLYASGDAGAVTSPSESNGYIAAYAGGNLGSAPTPIGQFSQSGRAFGPEGITVNTRGSGYGSFSGSTPSLVAVDSAGGTVGRVLTTLNTATSTAGSTVSGYFNTDDLAFVPGASAAADQFALIDAGGANPIIRYVSAVDGTSAGSGVSFNLPNQSKGLLYLTSSDAQWFDPGTADVSLGALLVAVGPDFAGDTNKLNLYTMTGTLISSTVIPTGAGLLGNIESLAWDPTTQRLFLGDENGVNSQIAVMVVPTPAAAGVLALGALAAARRRR